MNQMAISLGVSDEVTAHDELGDSYEGVALVLEERGQAISLDADSPGSESDDVDADATDVPERESDITNDTATAEPLPGFVVLSALGSLVLAGLLDRRRTRR